MDGLFEIIIEKGEQSQTFMVKDCGYHKKSPECQFEVYNSDTLVLGLTSDGEGFWEACKNPGNLDEDLINSIADKIESYYM